MFISFYSTASWGQVKTVSKETMTPAGYMDLHDKFEGKPLLALQ